MEKARVRSMRSSILLALPTLGLLCRMSKLWALVWSSPLLDIILPLATGLPSVFGFGALTFSLLTSFKCQRWFAYSRRPSRMASASLCIPLSKVSCSILMSVRPNFLPTYKVFWSSCWLSLGIKVSGYLALLCS